MKKQLSLVFLNYLRLLAVVQLAKISFLQHLKGKPLKIVGITGSAGKTSTMLAAESILKNYFVVKTNYGANSESGIPLNILGLQAQTFSITDWLRLGLLAPVKLLTNWRPYEVYLVEMGIDEPVEPKNMEYLLKIVRPHIAVFLGVNPVHSAQFDNTVPLHIKGNSRLNQILHNIASEKAKIITKNPSLTTAIINIDDKLVANILPSKNNLRLFTIGKTPKANFRTLNSTCGPKGFTANFKIDNRLYSLALPDHVLPQIYHISFAAALAIAKSLGVKISTSINQLKFFQPPLSRSSLLAGINNSLIIDSSYNSSPGTAEEMLALLSQFPAPRVAVLGDMGELGQQSALAHSSLYKESLKITNIIISVGSQTKKYFGPKAIKFDYWWQAANYLKTHLPPKASILVKGSQNTIFLEELVKQLLANPSNSSLLCRQSPYWLKVKGDFQNHLSTKKLTH